MFIETNSGLTRYQVQKQKIAAARGHQAMSLRLQWVALALIVSTVLLSGWLLSHSVEGASALAIVVLGASLLGQWQFKRWVNRLAQAESRVLVVRDGLVRQVTSHDLVAGDTIMVQAGMVTPVDLALAADLAKAPRLFTLLVRALGLRLPANTVVAGSTLMVSGQATVAAVGAERFLWATLVPALTTTQSLMVRGGIKLVCAWLVAIRHLRFGGPAVRRTQAKTHAQVLATLDFLTHMTLVGEAQLHQKETAFRYNQDPVPSPRLTH